MGRLHWRWCRCGKCSKPIGYRADTSDTEAVIQHELDTRMEEHQIHLCNSCDNEFATCKGNPVFGNCVGNDNVVVCDAYWGKKQQQVAEAFLQGEMV